MTAAVIGIAAALVMAAFAGSAFFIARIERRERKNGEKENAELRKHERDMAGSIADANAQKEKLQSGDSRADFDASVGILHEYAKKNR